MTGEYASPPCFMHELDSDRTAGPAQDSAWSDVARWRKAERKRLLDTRIALDVAKRHESANRIAVALEHTLSNLGGRTVSLYWPFRGEPDLRGFASRVIEQGGRVVLPVVIRRDWPLEFRIWSPGEPLERGMWDILVPARGPSVQPDIVVAPMVGFDEANYRLGYGGGFFDRTLAALPRRAFVVGVGYAASRLKTIYPQPHDVVMDAIVTDA